MSNLVLCHELVSETLGEYAGAYVSYKPYKEYFNPEDYKDITGEDYPDEGPVWWRHKTYNLYGDSVGYSLWKLGLYEDVVTDCNNNEPQVICAIGNPNPPPADWSLT